jgi:hypothetical protein
MTATISSSEAPPQVTRYMGVSDWWGRHVWLERNGVRGALPYRGDDPLAAFAWGRRGVGARELARSILHDATGSAALAERFCRELTHDLVARLPEIAFELDREEVLDWLAAAGATDAGAAGPAPAAGAAAP